ncbi:protein mini spindles isoform X2 [Maniola jurtina]|uniref:protein mini spindles isoform X2 n=1 Tax=Maniola jurtina TaxID=191418 RepID=UPI001E6861EA|nr:protein mini spindles isoform X2 [Maniola jurtina]
MEDENEYKKLPTDEKCVHKLWKARVAGYEEAIKLFNQIDDEKSPEWNKYLGLIKKFVTDSNAVAQERGLEAALVFVENCGHAGKTTGEVMSGIVAKCIAAPKTKTKDLALQITLMYIEIEKHEVVEEELLKGMEQKNPKVVAACVSALNSALKQFGNKVIAIKPMVKKIPILLADRDKGVRDEMKALVVEMHRWIGVAVEPHIASLQAVVQQELREAFSGSGGATPTRYLRSQQSRVRDTPPSDAVDGGADDDDAEAGGGDSPDMDPFELLDPVEILSKLPKDFYDKLENKKWQERKEALDALEHLLKHAPKLEPGDYADLVRALKKVISKDSNVMVVALGGRLLGMVASGLRNKFQPYAVACVQAILEKFKEKKTNVVTALREAIDAIYPCTNLEAIMEDMLAAFDNKNPSIKAESSLFLARALCHTQPAAFNKKLVKAYVAGLLKLLESADPAVRDAAAEALGTATKLVGEKNIAPHIGKLDNLKEQKIKEFADKAEIKVKVSAPKKEAKPKSATTATGKGDGKSAAGSSQPKPVKRPATAAKKSAAGGKKASARAQPSPPREQELSQEEIDAKAEQLFPEDVVNGLGDGNWKSRLVAVQSFHSTVQGLTTADTSAQILYRVLNKKPGLKDTNVQVLKARLEACKYITENFPVSTTAADFVLQDVVTKLAETSCATVSSDCLTSLAEGCGLEHVLNEGLTFAMDSQKNPKVQAEMFNWMASAIKEFGFTMNVKTIVIHAKKALAATNPNVRTSTINFLGILSLYVGPSLLNHFDSEKAATKQLISFEMDKYANSSPPTPTRQLGTVSKSASKGSMGDEIEEPYDEPMDDEPAVVEDNRPRTDIAPLITDSLVAEINDKNWKVRNEALDKVKALIQNSAPIKASLGELPAALNARLFDSNSKLAQSALQICELLASALGPKCKQHVRTFFPPFFQAFGDSKQWIRVAAVSCVEAWCNQVGPQAAFEGEMVYDALKSGSPVLRASLFQWVADKLLIIPLKAFPREELSVCVPILFACLEDRAADVRKASADCVLPFMLHLGYDAMHKQVDKLKPGSKSVVQAALDKARPNLPVQPLPSKAKKDEPKGVKSAGALKKEAEKKGGPSAKAKVVKPTSASSRGKKEDEDCTPLLPNNNAKNQRIVDDQKLKVLKWNFTTPREEFFELLKEQMNSAGLNKQLVANMFHSDFRYHLKAIEALSEDLHENGTALMANLDLVLKWLTLRFFDTNPSVILKGLEYLTIVFQYLSDSDYTMAEYEANCFIPYLVLKVGDPKDTVRNGVKALFKQICIVYSVTKLFGYLMEGLKSKNARQRAECLECINHLLETYGSAVMSGGVGASLRELARHIGDRDNAVRSAALNCVTSAYFLDGEKIYKMIGQISDKDLSLLEERIKRASKSRSADDRRSMLVPLSASGRPILQAPEEVNERVMPAEQVPPDDYEEEEMEEQPPPPAQALIPEPKVISGPFGLDPDLIAKLDAEVPVRRPLDMPEHDLKFLDEPVPATTVRAVTAPVRSTSMVTMSPPRLGAPLPSMPPSAHKVTVDDAQLADTIHSISSPDLNAAIRALSLISGALASGRGAALAAHETRLVSAIAAQLRRLRTAPPSAASAQQTLPAYRYIGNALTNFYDTAGCGRQVGEIALRSLLSELLLVLVATPAASGAAVRDADRLVRLLNNVCVCVLEHSPRTAVLCVIVSLLHDSIVESDPAYPRYQDLLLKCFWKTLKMISSWEVNSIDYDAVLYKIHLFYKAYPNSYWKKNPEMSDTPYRTVKTLVHTLVKMKGASIMNHLTQVPDVNESDLFPYLHKVLKQLKLDERKDISSDAVNGGLPSAVSTVNTALNAGRLPRGVHEELALILKRIGSKEHNRDALSQLYDLRERHPEVDIWTFMQGSSFYFRNYVERGLKEVAEQRKLASVPMYKSDYKTENIDISNENDEKSHVIFLERLRALQAKAGIKTESNPSSQPRTPVSDNRGLTDSINDNTLPRAHSIDPQLELHTTQSVSIRKEAGVDALRLKLQQIKSSSKR